MNVFRDRQLTLVSTLTLVLTLVSVSVSAAQTAPATTAEPETEAKSLLVPRSIVPAPLASPRIGGLDSFGPRARGRALGGVGTAAVGPLDPIAGGFAEDAFALAVPGLAQRLATAAPADPASPGLRALARRALASQARAPAGEGNDADSFYLARLAALARMGETALAARGLEGAPGILAHPGAGQLQARLALAAGKVPAACALLEAGRQGWREQARVLARLEAVCAALRRDRAGLAAAAGALEAVDPSLAGLARALAQGRSPSWEAWRPITLEAATMLRLGGVAAPESAGWTATPAALALVGTDSRAAELTRVVALERRIAMGLAESASLGGAYQALAASGSGAPVWARDVHARARAWLRMRDEPIDSPSWRAAWLVAWEATGQDSFARIAFLRGMAARLGGAPTDAELSASHARVMVAARALAGDTAAVAAWAAALARLAPEDWRSVVSGRIARVLAGEADFDGALALAPDGGGGAGAAAGAGRAAMVELFALEGLTGEAAPAGAWTTALSRWPLSLGGWGGVGGLGRWLDVALAAEGDPWGARRPGVATLLAAAVLGEQGAIGATPEAIGQAVRVLVAADLPQTARRVVAEALAAAL